MKISSYRDLDVWHKSVDLATEIYRLTASFPEDERFGLTSQIRRAAISVGANIAEGSGRATSRDFLGFLSYSRGSLKESESLLIVAQRLGFSTEAQCARAMQLADDVSRMLTGLRRRISARPRK